MPRNNSLWVLMLLLLSPIVSAQSQRYLAETGDVLEIKQLQNGEMWATLLISDQHTASFAHSELILLQLDTQPPLSLEHGNLSCGSPAKAAQTVFYDLSPQQTLLSSSTPQPLPKGFQQVRQRDDFSSLTADRRAETVDFVLNENTLSLQQFQQAKKVMFRFVTDDGIAREAIFQLQ